jgi:hypothetical protein
MHGLSNNREAGLPVFPYHDGPHPGEPLESDLTSPPAHCILNMLNYVKNHHFLPYLPFLPLLARSHRRVTLEPGSGFGTFLAEAEQHPG